MSIGQPLKERKTLMHKNKMLSRLNRLNDSRLSVEHYSSIENPTQLQIGALEFWKAEYAKAFKRCYGIEVK
jgi:hypothetical protein